MFRSEAESVYRLTEPELGIGLLADRLRRDRGEVVGEVTGTCELTGAHVVDDAVLSIGTFNFSNSRMRPERVRQLAERSRTGTKFDPVRTKARGRPSG